MISLIDVTKSYHSESGRRFTVFSDLNITIPERVHVGIVGRNGSGKSTLLKLIGGIELPDRGRVVTQGRVSPPLGLASGFAQKISGRDNARFISRVCGDTSEMTKSRISFIERFSALGEFFNRPVETYSTGMRARLAFSISMAFDYDYYLIDELTAVGDELFRAKAQSEFTRKKGESSVVMVSHNLGQLKRDCEVGLYVREGTVSYFQDISEAIDAYKHDLGKNE